MSITALDRRIGLRGALVLGLFVALFLTIGVSRASASGGFGYCAQLHPVGQPCISSATVDGNNVPDNDATWAVGLGAYQSGVDGFRTSGFTLNLYPGVAAGSFGEDMGSGAVNDTWSIVVNVGNVVPRVSYAQGQNVTFARNTPASGYMTITGSPVTVDSSNECDDSTAVFVCPENNDSGTNDAPYTTFNGQVDDYDITSRWTPAQVDAFYGMNMWTNIDETGMPPYFQDTPSGQQLVLQLANQHWADLANTQVFYGYVHLTIPYAFAEQFWGINDPSTLTTGGLATSIGSGTISVTQDPADSALQIDATGITFTDRNLKIRRGTVTPTRPLDLHAKRIGSSGRITFHKSRARGDRITGYQVTCTAKHWATRTARSSHSPITVHGLGSTGYVCAVRARSKAGNSRASYTKIAG
jgi:hypothetical protein